MIDGKDYWEVFANSGENPQGGRPAKDYLLTVPTAKELSMVERNAQGKAARRYFIDCEERVKKQMAPALDMSDLLMLAKRFIKAEEPSSRPSGTYDAGVSAAVPADRVSKAHGKLIGNYSQMRATKDFLKALEASIGNPIDGFVITKTNVPRAERGTWVHPRVAIDLARWCSPAFAVWVDGWVHDWMKGHVPSQ